jgi:hypothetical protein
MGMVVRSIIACFVALALAACETVSTTPLEPQSKQRDARLARLYFIWPKSFMFRTGTLDIKVDEQVVGKIAPDSYMFIDRKPGTYALKVEPPFDWTYFESDVQVAAGATYYYAINVRSATIPVTGGRVVGAMTLNHPNPGTVLRPKGDGISFATYKLSALDAATAAAEMAKLDAQ